MSFISEKDQGFLCKIIVVGNQGVGKSSLLMQYTQNDFKTDYNVTIGVEFASKQIIIEKEKPPMTLQIWDTAGQESFKSIVRTFYQQAAAAFIVYNVTKRSSFEALDEWIKEIREFSHQDIVLVIVGNQIDKNDQRKVSYEEGLNYTKNNNCDLFHETSAKTSENIENVFEEVGQIVFYKFIQNLSFQGSFQSNENNFQNSVEKKNEKMNKKADDSPNKKYSKYNQQEEKNLIQTIKQDSDLKLIKNSKSNSLNSNLENNTKQKKGCC